MDDHYVLYVDVENLPRQGFMRPSRTYEMKLIKEKVIPSWEEHAPIHVHWHRREVGGIRLHLLTYLNKELTERQAEDLLDRALAFVQDR